MDPTPAVGDLCPLSHLERHHAQAVLNRVGSLSRTACVLGIDQATLYRKRLRWADEGHPLTTPAASGVRVLLSVLIPSLPERAPKLVALMAQLAPHVAASNGRAEVLVLTDFRTMPLGEKRNHLMRIAAGEFVVHLDDDDALTDAAIPRLLDLIPMLAPEVDVIAYRSEAKIDEREPFIVDTSIAYENEQVKPLGDARWCDIRRKPWHWCCWRRELAARFRFVGRIDEDWQWLSQVLPHVRRELKLDEVLHRYHHDPKDSFCLTEPRA